MLIFEPLHLEYEECVSLQNYNGTNSHMPASGAAVLRTPLANPSEGICIWLCLCNQCDDCRRSAPPFVIQAFLTESLNDEYQTKVGVGARLYLY